jgi:hypothetical protein
MYITLYLNLRSCPAASSLKQDMNIKIVIRYERACEHRYGGDGFLDIVKAGWLCLDHK